MACCLLTFFFSCPFSFSAEESRVALPLGAALHYLQEQVDGLQALVPSLAARDPHLPLPDPGQWEVRDNPFLRQHLLQNLKPCKERKLKQL